MQTSTLQPSPFNTAAVTSADGAVMVTALSHDGRGIAHCNGKTIFIDGALPGEKVNFTYLRRHAKFDEARLTAVIETTVPSLRVAPHCQHFGVCGGCSLQHLQHAAQLELKQRILLEQFTHIGGINVAPQNIIPPLTAPVWNYRHKGRFSVKYVAKKGRVLLGFHEKNGRFIVDGMQNCPILHVALSDKVGAICELIASLSCYQAIPQVEVACGSDANKGDDVALIIRHLQPLLDSDSDKLRSFAMQHNLRIFLQPQGLDSVHCITHDSDFLHYNLDNGQKLQFLPSDFTQVNHALNQKMVTRVIELLDLQSHDKVLDLFCGIGNFTLPIATHCAQCNGVEGSMSAVERARTNAEYNKVENVRFFAADLNCEAEEAITKSVPEWAKMAYTKVVLDPPRVGAFNCLRYLTALGLIERTQQKKKKTAATITAAHTIVYISCNPATLARDAKELVQVGYTLTRIGIMDMFPHTSHVESIAVFKLV